MKTTLLIDINDTLDDGSNLNSRDRQHALEEEMWIHIWVAGARKWIEDFAEFLVEYKEKLLPIFWTTVWPHGQKFVADTFLNTDIIWFDRDTFLNFNNFSPKLDVIKGWIITPKSYYFPLLLEYIKWKSEHIIWFEDVINLEDQNFVDSHNNINHVWIDQDQTLTEKIPEIIKLIK